MIFKATPFWEKALYKDAHLSKVELPADAIEKIYQWWKKPSGIFFFGGNPGCGKTYLLAAMIHDLIEKKQTDLRYFTERDFYSYLRTVIERNWDYTMEIQRICEARILFLDDIGFCQSTEFQKECISSLIDERMLQQLPTIITSNLFLEHLAELYHPRVVSRLKAKNNCIVELNWKDKRQ